MITLTSQRNDSKSQTDTIFLQEDSIAINGESFMFEKGVGIEYESIHEQIIGAYRDDKGVLHATVIKQYISKDKDIFESTNYQVAFDVAKTRVKLQSIVVPVKEDANTEKTVVELIHEKNIEIKQLKEEYVDADLDDNEALKLSLKTKIQELKKQIAILEEGNNGE